MFLWSLSFQLTDQNTTWTYTPTECGKFALIMACESTNETCAGQLWLEDIIVADQPIFPYYYFYSDFNGSQLPNISYGKRNLGNIIPETDRVWQINIYCTCRTN